jgi:two-component system KDP operon response regulator KdpE
MSLRILVVEDDREIRALMQSTLSVEGFEVQTAVSVSEASAMLRHALPDVMLLDLGLPDGDGVALVHQVRQHHALPILVVSARHQESQKIALLDAGADDYLVKPFSVGELLARIRVALRSCLMCGGRNLPTTPITCACTWPSCAPKSSATPPNPVTC